MMRRQPLLLQLRDVRHYWGWSPPPLGLLYLAGAVPGTVVVDCAQEGHDECAVIDDLRPALVGVTAFTATRHAALAILRHAHDMGARTVLGGPHVSTRRVAEWTAARAPWVDHIVMGDGEAAWSRLAAGEPLPRIIRGAIPARLDDLAPPDWSAVPIGSYPARGEGYRHGVDLGSTPRISVVFSRGCPGHCRFCAAWKRPLRAHSPDYARRNILAPLAAAGIRHLCLDDDCWASDEAAALEMCGILGEYGFVWEAETRADLLTPAMARAMARSGCWQIAVGVEHGAARMRSVMGKPMSDAVLLRARAAAWDAGLAFHALMLEGYPGETDEDRKAAARFLSLLQPDTSSTVGMTFILPGTDLYSDKITDDSWLETPARHVVWSPRRGAPVAMGE